MKTPVRTRKKPGPPRTTGPGEQVVVRLHQPMLGAIDEWRADQEGEPTRAEALRRLAQRGLDADATVRPRRPVKRKDELQ
jgi:hypothetical protein